MVLAKVFSSADALPCEIRSSKNEVGNVDVMYAGVDCTSSGFMELAMVYFTCHVAAHGEGLELLKKFPDAFALFFCHSNTTPSDARVGQLHFL